MREIVPIVVLALLGACTDRSVRTATVYDVADYPHQDTAIVGPAPQSAGTLVIKAAGGRPVQCGEPSGARPCERVRLLPGMTILRLDFIPSDRRRFAPAADIDLPITVQGGHTYHLVATIERDPTPGQGRTRVVVEAVDVGR